MTSTKELKERQISDNELIRGIADNLVDEIDDLIGSVRQKVAQEYNSSHVLLCWYIGSRLDKEFIKQDRTEYGRGFTYSSLTRMVKFYEYVNDLEIVATLSQQLTWSHIIELLPIEDTNKRNFYTYMSISEGWSVRSLRSNINKMNYERSFLAKQSTEVTTESINNIKTNKVLPSEAILKDR